MRVILFVSLFGMWTGLCLAQNQEGAAPGGKPPVKLAVELSDGSRIIGPPDVDTLKAETTYASSMDIALSLVRSIQFNPDKDDKAHTVQINLRNGDVLNVHLAANEIGITTLFGHVSIPFGPVNRITASVADSKMPDGLVLHYTFDGNEGANVTDDSNSGNDGKVEGATYVNEGKVGGGMSFQGGQQKVTIKTQSSLQLQDFTIMAWVKRANADKVSDSGYAVIFGFGKGGYMMGLQDRLYLSKTDIDSVYSDWAIPADKTFHHMAVTKKGKKIVFYLDGVPHAANDYDTNFTFTGDAAVGSRPDAGRGGFNGTIDEVAVFNRALSDDEVKTVYDSQK